MTERIKAASIRTHAIAWSHTRIVPPAAAIFCRAAVKLSCRGPRPDRSATRLGADDVIKAEQAVARQFYEMLQRKLATRS